MEINRLYSIAEKSGITVERFDLKENGSVSVKSGQNLYVALDNEMSGAKEKVCLAHEIGHCVTLSFYNMYSPLDIRGKHERKAQNWAIKALVPKTKLKTALKKGYDNVYSLAEYFGVTTDFMLQAVEFYRGA